MNLNPWAKDWEFLIFVVADPSPDLNRISIRLEQSGYTVIVMPSSNLENCITVPGHFIPDLLLLDWVGDGPDLETVAQLRQRYSANAPIPLLLLLDSQMSGLDLESFQDAIAQETIDCLVKPIRGPELLACVRRHVELAQARFQLQYLTQTVHRFNIDLEAEVERRTVQLRQALTFEATLKRISETIRDSLDETQILQAAIQELTQTLQIDGCNAGIYDLQAGTSTVTYEYSPFLPSSVGMVYQYADFPELYCHLLNGQCAQFCWHPHYFHEDCAVDLDYTRTSTLICPIQDDQGIVGDLWLYKRNQDGFEETEIRLVQHVATQCAIALRQARLYQKAQSQVRELERLNQLKNDFLCTISHELRTPIANIEMVSNLLAALVEQDELGQMEQIQTRRYVAVVQDECQRELNLINDLLELVRLDSETEPLVLEPIDLKHFVPYLLEPFVDQMQRQDLRLDLVLPSVPFQFKSDATLLKRVLTELLTNACKYTPQYGTIEVLTEVEGDRLTLTVSNTGVELPESELDRIFDTFYRIPNNDPWKHGGMGLGLALVRKQVRHLGGTVRAFCADGKFAITLQFHPHSENLAPAARREACQNLNGCSD